MNSRSIFIVLAVSLLLLGGGCGKAPAGKELPGRGQPADSTCAWLADGAHFHTENYYAVFTEYYGRQLQAKNYASAAEALKAVADREMYYLFFDTAFGAVLQSFDTLYADRLPWPRTLFIEEHAGYRLLDRGEFRKAISHFRKVSAYTPYDYDSYLETANLYSDMAFCYAAVGDQEQALRCNRQALFYFDQIGSLTGQGGVYDNIALVHLFTKNYTEAETYFGKAMQAFREAGDTDNMFNTVHNLLLLYEETEDPRRYPLIDSAYRLFTAGHYDDVSLGVGLSFFYVDKLLHEGKMAEAKVVLEDMRASVEKQYSQSAEEDYLVASAQYELKTGRGILNTRLMEDALRAAEVSEHFQNQLAFCAVLKEDALRRGDYKKALSYSEKEKTATERLANREMVVKTMELNKRNETELKEQHIALQAETILNKNITIALLLALLLTFLLVAAVIYSRQKQKKIRTESRRALKYTRQLLEKTEEERRRIAGDLHDSVSHELLILKNALHAGHEGTGAQIDVIINDIRTISRNLHPIMFEKVGLAASLEQLAERARSIHDLMVTADISYDGFLSTSDELQVYRIVQEALSNTIKYAEAFAAKITVMMRNDGLSIEIKDNGKGFDVAGKMAGNTAFGLHNIQERSKAIGGTARIHSDRGGTVITIEIKKMTWTY